MIHQYVVNFYLICLQAERFAIFLFKSYVFLYFSFPPEVDNGIRGSDRVTPSWFQGIVKRTVVGTGISSVFALCGPPSVTTPDLYLVRFLYIHTRSLLASSNTNISFSFFILSPESSSLDYSFTAVSLTVSI